MDSDIAEYKEIEFQKRHPVFKHLVFIMLMHNASWRYRLVGSRFFCTRKGEDKK